MAIPNIFASGMSAFDDQTQRLNQFATQRATRDAGAAIAGGDYQGGSDTLNRAGMLGEAHNVLADNLALQDRKTADQNLAADRAQKSKAIMLEGLAHITDAIQKVPEGQRSAWLKAQMPSIQGLGLPADAFANADESQLTDAALAPFRSMLGNAMKGVVVGPGAQLLDSQSGKVMGSTPFKPEYHTLGEGQSLVETGGAQGSATPAPAGQPAPMAQTAPASGQPRAVRNNNPLNLTTLSQGQWDGQTGADGRFAQFSTPEAGIAAADKNLQAYATKHGINTLSGIIQRWAPAGDGANNPQAYVQTVSQDLGVDPNQPLNLADPKVRAVVLHSMAKVEMGGSSPSNAPQTAAAPAQAPAGVQTASGARVIAQGPPKAVQWVSDGKGNLINQATGDRKVDPTVAGAGGTPTGDTKLTGPEYLTSLPPSRAAQVKAMLDGRMDYPTSFALKTPYWQAMIADAAQVDPSFDEVNFKARAATRKDFTSGKAANTLTMFNTALAHMDNLTSAIDGLGNYGLPANNQAAHFIAGVTGTDARVQRFETVKRATMDEVNKALVGSGGALADRESLMKRLDAAANPATLKAVVAEIADLLHGKINAMGQQYAQGMGTTASPIQLVTPAAQRTLDRLQTGGRAAAPPGVSASDAALLAKYGAH